MLPGATLWLIDTAPASASSGPRLKDSSYRFRLNGQCRYSAKGIPMVRSTDPITSRLAALSVNNKDVDLKILAHLVANGSKTSLELSDELGIAYVTISPCPIRLRRDGLIHQEGLRKNRTGRHACVWAIGGTPGGMCPVATGPQRNLKFRRFEPQDILAMWTKCPHTLEALTEALNYAVVVRLG